MFGLVDVQNKNVKNTTAYYTLMDMGFSTKKEISSDELIREQWRIADEIYLVTNNFSPKGENNRLVFFITYYGDKDTPASILAIESMEVTKLRWIRPEKGSVKQADLLDTIRRSAAIKAKDHGLGNWADLEEVTMALFYQEGPTSYHVTKHE